MLRLSSCTCVCIFVLQHPNIFPTEFATANETGGLVIRAFHETGSLRDVICKCKPKGHYLRKYGNPKVVTALDMEKIQSFGRQILETLKFLHDKGFPYGKMLVLCVTVCCWAVQWSWFARVNALCNLLRKKSREVTASLLGWFLSRRCFTLCITMEVEPRISKLYKCHHRCSCKNYWGKGIVGGKKVSLRCFWLTRGSQFHEKNAF